MSDDMDRAQEREQLIRSAAIASRITCEAAPIDAAEPLDCLDCGEEIPEDRRAALPSAERCVFCQQIIERTRRRR